MTLEVTEIVFGQKNEGNYRIHHHKEDLISIIENFDQPANLVGMLP